MAGMDEFAFRTTPPPGPRLPPSAAAQRRAAAFILARFKERCPVRTGRLRRSLRVSINVAGVVFLRSDVFYFKYQFRRFGPYVWRVYGQQTANILWGAGARRQVSQMPELDVRKLVEARGGIWMPIKTLKQKQEQQQRHQDWQRRQQPKGARSARSASGAGKRKARR